MTVPAVAASSDVIQCQTPNETRKTIAALVSAVEEHVAPLSGGGLASHAHVGRVARAQTRGARKLGAKVARMSLCKPVRTTGSSDRPTGHTTAGHGEG